MDDEELDIPKGSVLKQLTGEDLSVHSIENLNTRVAILNAEIKRTDREVKNKKSAHSDADSIFK